MYSHEEMRTILQNRIKNFWGYGNLAGKTWLVGMEEGHSGEWEELIQRLAHTSERAVYDIVLDMTHVPEHMSWFAPAAPTQSTYRRYIFLLLYLESGKVPTIEAIRDMQINSFARKGSEHAVLELMPLPARSIKKSDWLYVKSGVPFLDSREEYLMHYKPERTLLLREMIRMWEPRIVLLFSLKYRDDWQEISDTPLREEIAGTLLLGRIGVTLLAVVPHPTAHGYSTNDWTSIAEALSSALSTSPRHRA